MDALKTYLQGLRDVRAYGAGVKEQSYKPKLAELLSAVGSGLKPKVTCILELQNAGAGNPDGGLYDKTQLQKGAAEPRQGQAPSRGALEVKSTQDDAWVTADSAQVSKYWKRYRQVLVTNYRDFVLVGSDKSGLALILESYRLAESEDSFWHAALGELLKAHGGRFEEFLRRVLLHPVSLEEPKDLAWFLASYARDARERVEAADPMGAYPLEPRRLPVVAALKEALEESLGLSFAGPKGEHFFRSTLVQTLFYGVFSAWVLWHKEKPSRTDRFSWKEAEWSLHVPMIRALFEQIASPGKVGPLGLIEVMDWTEAVLNRVDRAAFFAKFQEAEAVQYFYEPFLEAFDPELRKELGVWYTPPEIVKYMVARVDAVLKSELGLADGLADERVVVLDPCCGTGAYLVEVLRRISATLSEREGAALAAREVKRAATERVFGFEILPAPFVVSHLQIGLFLQGLGAPLSDEKNERAGVFLTNALTGWEPPIGKPDIAPFDEFEQEKAAAGRVKREARILVILGNPPYNAFAGISPREEQGLVEPYKKGLAKEWGIRKYNLDDLYVRFFRLAERSIAEKSGRGVVSFISNHSWVSEPSFVVLRKHLLESFDKFWIENLHGDRKISEYAPDGRTSETVFAIKGFSAGIQQGVATSLWVKTGKGNAGKSVRFRDDLDAAKATDRRAQLLNTLNGPNFDDHYQEARPEHINRYSFRPANVDACYLSWPLVTELCASPPSNGLMEKRGGALMDNERETLMSRMRMWYDPGTDWGTLTRLAFGLTRDAARFVALKARNKVIGAEKFQSARVRRYALRPFETCWCYYSPVRPLWNEPRPTLWAQCWEGNSFVLSRMKAGKCPEGPPFYYCAGLSDDHLLSPDASCFPFRLRRVVAQKSGKQGQFGAAGEGGKQTITANLSHPARSYLSVLGIPDPDSNQPPSQGLPTPHELIWMHALAIGYSLAYLTENADGIRQDWPRIPLPASKELLLQSAALGKRVAVLLDTEAEVPGVTEGAIRPELKTVAVLTCAPGAELDLSVTVGWGHAGKGGITMPGRGRALERGYTADEQVALGASSTLLGDVTLDVYLNPTTFWANIPEKVWAYTIGGYQVLKKWLSYREQVLLGRPLHGHEAKHIMNTARRLAALILLQPELDENYRCVKSACVPLPEASKVVSCNGSVESNDKVSA